MPAACEFRNAVRTLHREKDRAYGSAWKRRGELLSVVANVARKVDRIEHLAAGAEPTRDESALDTAVDLLVYSLKYQTYLADLDSDIAATLFGASLEPPYSDGPAGFDALLDGCDLSPLDQADVAPVAGAAGAVATAFAVVEQCLTDQAPAEERQRCAADLAATAVELAGALRSAAPSHYAQFIAVWQDVPGPTPVTDHQDQNAGRR